MICFSISSAATADPAVVTGVVASNVASSGITRAVVKALASWFSVVRPLSSLYISLSLSPLSSPRVTGNGLVDIGELVDFVEGGKDSAFFASHAFLSAKDAAKAAKAAKAPGGANQGGAGGGAAETRSQSAGAKPAAVRGENPRAVTTVTTPAPFESMEMDVLLRQHKVDERERAKVRARKKYYGSGFPTARCADREGYSECESLFSVKHFPPWNRIYSERQIGCFTLDAALGSVSH